ncbi:PfkB family carbohydrate kinase [Candidatus Omnitrophota bacterium]
MNKNKKKIVSFGEIMLRFSPYIRGENLLQASNFIVQPGGSESNVAIALSNLGQPCSFLTKIPKEGFISRKIISYLRNHSVDTSNIVFGGSRIGTYWTEMGIGPRPYQVFYDRDHSSFCEISFSDLKWNSLKKKYFWFHTSGISAAVSKKSCYTLRKILISSKSDLITSIDLNYRSKLWRWTGQRKQDIYRIMWDLCSNVALLSGNEADFSDALGFTIPTTQDIAGYTNIAQECFKRLRNLRYIAISLRKLYSASENDWSGILFVRKGKRFDSYTAHKTRITNIVDRVGTGDSFTAGIIFGLINYKNNFQKTLNFAVALSTLKHSIRGDASIFTACDVENYFKNSEAKILR